MSRNSIVSILLVLGLSGIHVQGNPLKLTFHNATIDANPKYLMADVHLKNVDHRSFATINATVLEELKEPLLLDGCMTRLKTSDLYNDTVIAFENVNYCNVHRLSEKNPIINVIFLHVGKFGNIMSECPVKKMNYYVNDYFIEDDKLQAYLLPGAFRTRITLSMIDSNKEKVKIYESVWYATVG